MYINVDKKNQIQLEEFNRIWIECWKEKGYELEFTLDSDKIIILDEEEQGIGTVEFIKYRVGQNACEEVYPFHDLIEVKTNIDRVVEIDKIALTKTFRGQNIDKVLYIISKYTKENNLRYGIGLMEPVFYKAMKMFYKIPITKLSKKVFYKGDWVIPVLIDCEYTHINPSEFKSIGRFEDSKERKISYVNE